jgi:SAM-dependent methyltransferase
MERHTYDRMRELQRDHWWFAARREILSAEIARLPLPRPARILEVGCGPGGNLEMLQAFGAVCAIEPDAASRAYAADHSGADVREGLLPDRLPEFGGPFDLAVALDVIEHVEEDAAAVAAVARRLKPCGWFLATVPANAWMWSEHDEAHHHQRRYGLDGFRQLVAGAGLTVRRATHFNTLLFPPIAAVRLAKQAFGAVGGDDESMPSPLVNGFLKHAFAAERPLLRRMDLPFGVSLLVIAQKPL